MPAVFGTPYYVPSYSGANYNFTSVRMKNIVLQVKSQVNNVDVAATMCGINANYLNQYSIENAVIGTESILYNTATQASSTTYGIIFPYFLNNALTMADRITFTGFHWGAYVSDHFDGGQITSVFCWYALKYENGTPGNAAYRGHDAIIKHLQVELCPYGINITGEGGLHINLYSGERDNLGSWWQTTGNDVDFTGSGVSGTVTVDAIDMTNVGVPDYAITSNDYSRFKLIENNGHRVSDYVQTPANASSYTLNLIKGKRAIIQLNQNATLAITNAVAGDRVSIEVGQDGTGGYTLTPSDPGFSNTGTFVISPAPLTGAIVDGFYDGVYWVWDIQNVTALASNNPATVFISTLNSNGYAAGGTEQTGYQTFYTNAVAHGYYSKLKAFYTFSGTTSTTQAINFLNPGTYTIAWTGSNTFNSGGYTGNGSTGYGNTGFNPNTSISSANSAAFGVWTTTTSTPSFACVGVYTGTGNTPDFQMGFNYDGTHSFGSIAGSTDFVSVNNPSPYSGLFTTSRTASNLITVYQNSTSLGTATGTSRTALPNDNFYIGARKANGSAAQFSAQTYIFLFIADGLTSGEVTSLYSDLSALKTAMGR